MRKLLYALAFALALPLQTVFAGPPQVVNVHEYAACNGTTTPSSGGGVSSPDDTAGIQWAIDHWLWWGSRPGFTPTNAVLDFGSGNCLISSSLRFYHDGWAPASVHGIVRGDGPEAMTIRSSCCFRAFNFKQFQHGEISGIKFSGGPAPTVDNNHAGIVLGNYGSSLGSFGNKLENLSFEHFGAALVLGDQDNAASAADTTFINIGASQNNIGVYAVTYNTLDLRFVNLMLTENNVGVYTDTAYGMEFSGASTNNGTTFYLQTCCEFHIHDWREEMSSKSHYFVQYGGPTETRLTMDSVQVIDTLGRQMGNVVSYFPGSNAAVSIRGSFLNGNVTANKSVHIESSAIASASPYAGTPTSVFIQGVCHARISDSLCIGDFPYEAR
jgi:hypothetical protein